jgi:hypothetical protein
MIYFGLLLPGTRASRRLLRIILPYASQELVVRQGGNSAAATDRTICYPILNHPHFEPSLTFYLGASRQLLFI